MTTSPVHSTPAVQNEAAERAAPRPTHAPQKSAVAVPHDKVTISSQASKAAPTERSDSK